MKELKERFIKDCENQKEDPVYLVVVVKLPGGQLELITNTMDIGAKAAYYEHAYDENFCLKTNPIIQIVNYMLV